MLVKDLINELSKHNPDAEVFRYDDYYDGVAEIFTVDADELELLVFTKKAGKPSAVIIY